MSMVSSLIGPESNTKRQRTGQVVKVYGMKFEVGIRGFRFSSLICYQLDLRMAVSFNSC